MPRRQEESPFQVEMRAYRRVIHRTNTSGLASRADYETAFGAMAREQREGWLAAIPLWHALRARGVAVSGVGLAGIYHPGEELPAEIRSHLERVNEVVEANPTQVLHMRESGGARAADFSVRARMDAGILMVTLGDTRASRVRRAAWVLDSAEEWTLTPAVHSASMQYGFSKEHYVRMSTDPAVGMLPLIDSEAARAARANDLTGGRLASGVWMSYAGMTSLLELNPS